MHAIVSELLKGALTSIVEVTVEHVARAAIEPRAPDGSAVAEADPVDEASGAINGFLQALVDRDTDALVSWCHLPWIRDAETGAFLDQTLAAAPPISWGFTESYVPEDWAPGARLPWLVAELAVTFDVGARYETIPAVLRAISTRRGWRIDYLWWGEEAAPEPAAEPEANWFTDVSLEDLVSTFGQHSDWGVAPAKALIECARCGQNLSVPTDKGRLRVTCPKCSNVQWYVP